MSLRPLAQTLKGWSPPVAGRQDPLSAVMLAWPAIVGHNVAQHTRPTAIQNDALVVTTQSSAWSQQLSFLAEEIVSRLHAIEELRTVAKLRFRVGRVRGRVQGSRTAPPSQARSPRGAAIEPLREGATPAEALARLRANIDARRSTARHTCPHCGALQRAAVACAPCAENVERARRTEVQRLMYDAPWLGYGGIAKLVDGLTREEYERWRAALLARWAALLARLRYARQVSDVERRVSSSFVLLQSGLEPDRVTPAVIRTVLGDEVCALLEASHQKRRP